MTEIHSRLILTGEPPFLKNGALETLLTVCGMSAKWEMETSKEGKEIPRWAHFVKNTDEIWDAAQKRGKSGGAVLCPFRGGCIVSDAAGGSALIFPGRMALPADILEKKGNPAPVSKEEIFSAGETYREERLRLLFWTTLLLCFGGEEKMSLLAAADKARRAMHNAQGDF